MFDDEAVDEVAEHQVRMVEENMRAEGVATHVTVQADYFGFEVTHKVMLPDGISFIEHKEMTEGARRLHLNESNRGLRIQRSTGDALVNTKPGDERHSLLKRAIVGWNLIQGDKFIPFNDRNLGLFLESANPRIVELVEKDVRKHNPWLLADLTLEDMVKERDNLNEMIEVKEKEDEGKASSKSR